MPMQDKAEGRKEVMCVSERGWVCVCMCVGVDKSIRKKDSPFFIVQYFLPPSIKHACIAPLTTFSLSSIRIQVNKHARIAALPSPRLIFSKTCKGVIGKYARRAARGSKRRGEEER